MSKKIEKERSEAEGVNEALSQYLRALEDVYPAAKGMTGIVVRQDNRIIVSVPLPKRVKERMRLFDRMAEVGTELLLQTDQYIVLSAR
jgi:hypothetical protein